MNYSPKPVDTTNVILSGELLELTEKLAKNTHEVWAKLRIEQGWVYGNSRDDELKTHPMLIPYESLPESEKQFDRNTAMETIKLFMTLGYEIKKRST